MPTSDTKLLIHVYGHGSANPQGVAECFGGAWAHEVHSDSDLAIFAVNPSAGIDQETIQMWSALDEYQIPRMVVVTNLEKLEADFDDAVMLATRVFDQLIAPYLVLHDDAGLPIALIALEDLRIIDYTTTPPMVRNSDEEHQILVQEFRTEFLEQKEAFGEGAFKAGLMFPAIPLWIEKGIGIDIIKNYLEELRIDYQA